MGHDFANYQVFCGNSAPDEVHAQLITELPTILGKLGYQVTQMSSTTGRHIVICPPKNRWIGIYDSIASGDNPGNSQTEQFTIALSKYKPVVSVALYDSAILHLFVYRNGRKVDQFVNSSLYFHMLKEWRPSEAHEESDFYGDPEQWTEFLGNRDDLNVLKQTWQREPSGDRLLREVSILVGWDTTIVQGGYVLYNDAGPFQDFRDYLKSGGINPDSVNVFHFRKQNE